MRDSRGFFFPLLLASSSLVGACANSPGDVMGSDDAGRGSGTSSGGTSSGGTSSGGTSSGGTSSGGTSSGGTSSGGTSSGGSSSGVLPTGCPASPPAAGTVCSTVYLSCQYGHNDPSIGCDT